MCVLTLFSIPELSRSTANVYFPLNLFITFTTIKYNGVIKKKKKKVQLIK